MITIRQLSEEHSEFSKWLRSTVLRVGGKGHYMEKPSRQEPIEEERQLAEQAHLSFSLRGSNTTEDQLDEAWEDERKRRERELSRALVEEWLSNGGVFGRAHETERIKKLKSALDGWTTRRPQGFEQRQAKKQEEERANTKAALVVWLQRHKG